MPHPVPMGSPKWWPTWAQAADRMPCSGEPPDMAPVRRSETKGQVPRIAGAPGLIAFTYTSPPRHSAQAWDTVPARHGGAVAPACPAESSNTGIPPSTATRRHSRASSANFIGGTTKQFDWLTKGRARQASSPPATICNNLSVFSRCCASVQALPTCLVVPMMQL